MEPTGDKTRDRRIKVRGSQPPRHRGTCLLKCLIAVETYIHRSYKWLPCPLKIALSLIVTRPIYLQVSRSDQTVVFFHQFPNKTRWPFVHPASVLSLRKWCHSDPKLSIGPLSISSTLECWRNERIWSIQEKKVMEWETKFHGGDLSFC